MFDNKNFTKPFWGKLSNTVVELPDWSTIISLLDSHPEELYHRVNEKFRISLNSFHQRGSSPKFAKNILAEMQKTFYKNKITNIAFIGVGRNTESYPLHKDNMDVFLFQVLGNMKLKVGENQPVNFIPGDYVYIPRGTQHQILPEASRVTFSFGVEGDSDPSKYLTL